MKLRMMILGFGLALFAAGCGGGTVTIEGKATKGGQPYDASKDGDLNIGLTAVEGGKNFSAKAGEGGNFKIDGVPPGKYNVNVTVYPAANAAGKGSTPPMPANKKLPDTWDVSSSSKSFTLEVEKLK